MRLRLAVHRHGLPPANILWNTDGLRPNHHASGSNTTVAQFLDQVNEVVPLETEEWGLEDYVVEVKGFECLHYSVLTQILKDEDQVTIRPLQQSDRRFLRVSGRHQISSDGKHLIDGVAFGRPFLRRSDRPSIRIPSIKRARLVYDDIDDLEPQANGTTQLVLREDGEDELESLFGPEEYGAIDDVNGDGLDVYDEDTANAQGSLLLKNGRRRSQRLTNTRKRRRAGLGIGLEDSLPEGMTNESTRQRRRIVRASGPGSPSRRSSRSSTKSVRFGGNELETPATILAPQESDDDDDEEFNPNAEDSDVPESNKENVEPALEGPEDESTSSSDISSSDTSSSESDLETSSSDSDSDSNSDSVSLSSSTSSSLTSSASESVSSTGKRPKQPNVPTPRKEKMIGDTAKATTDDVKDTPIGTFVAPGSGSRATKRRNARRKIRQKMLEKGKNGLPEAANLTTNQADQEHLEKEALEAKRQALLGAMFDGTEISTKVDTLAESVSFPSQPNALDESPHATHDLILGQVDGAELPVETNQIQEISQFQAVDDDSELQTQGSPDESLTKTQARRNRLDTASSRRLIFGSLGLRAPKSKQEEDDLRNRLRPKAKESQRQAQQQNEVESDKQAIDYDKSWRDHVVLKAVECCHDNIELSTPPFPFVQRWDPQQQGTYGGSWGKRRGGKDKRRKRNNSQYYQEYKDFNNYDFDHESFQENFQEPETPTQAAVNQQILQDAGRYPSASQLPKGLDLPELPSDLSKCETLSAVTAKEGSIVAFKQMEMSEKTNWCPIISPFRTAKIDRVLQNGSIALVLASRDVPFKNRKYDPKTGQRLYDKFEMPGDDDDEDEDDAHLELSLLDMIEPKLIIGGSASEQKSSETSEAQTKHNHVPVAPNPTVEEDEDRHFVDLVGPGSRSTTNLQRGGDRSEPRHKSAQLEKEMSESTRQEYSVLIRDAGFRSEVATDVSDGLIHGSEPIPREGHYALGFKSDIGEVNKFSTQVQEPAMEKGLSFETFDETTDPHASLGQGIPQSSSQYNVASDDIVTTSKLSSPQEAQEISALDFEQDELMPEDEFSDQVKNTDPELFPTSNESYKIPPTSSPPPVDFQKPKRESRSKKKKRSSPINGDSSFPSPGYLLSQPIPRMRREDEEWDAEYFPPSTTSAGNSRLTRKNNKRSTRQTMPSVQDAPSVSDDDDDMVKAPKKRKSPQNHSLGLDGANDPSSPPESEVDINLPSLDSNSGSEDDSPGRGRELPRGPGWVSKKKSLPKQKGQKKRVFSRTRSNV